jgi:hypothetical protein
MLATTDCGSIGKSSITISEMCNRQLTLKPIRTLLVIAIVLGPGQNQTIPKLIVRLVKKPELKSELGRLSACHPAGPSIDSYKALVFVVCYSYHIKIAFSTPNNSFLDALQLAISLNSELVFHL